jgi:hypothetical protein
MAMTGQLVYGARIGFAIPGPFSIPGISAGNEIVNPGINPGSCLCMACETDI